MTTREIFKVATKIGGLYFIILASIGIKQAIYFVIGTKLTGQDTVPFILAPLFEVVFYVTGAWVLIAKANIISTKLIGTDEPTTIGLSKIDLTELVIVGICVSVIVSSLPEILSKLTQFVYFNEYANDDGTRFWKERSRKADIFYSVFKLAIGLLVLTNAKIISKRLTKIGDKDEKQS